MGKHTARFLWATHRGEKAHFSTLIKTLQRPICPLGEIVGTEDFFHPKALLAAMDAAAAKLMVLAPTIRIQKETPLNLPSLALAHRSRSLFFSF